MLWFFWGGGEQPKWDCFPVLLANKINIMGKKRPQLLPSPLQGKLRHTNSTGQLCRPTQTTTQPCKVRSSGHAADTCHALQQVVISDYQGSDLGGKPGTDLHVSLGLDIYCWELSLQRTHGLDLCTTASILTPLAPGALLQPLPCHLVSFSASQTRPRNGPILTGIQVALSPSSLAGRKAMSNLEGSGQRDSIRSRKEARKKKKSHPHTG